MNGLPARTTAVRHRATLHPLGLDAVNAPDRALGPATASGVPTSAIAATILIRRELGAR